MLLEYFMEGMVHLERRMLDASAQGSILDMYPEEIWELIEKVAESTRYLEDTRKQAPVSNVGVQSEMQELKTMMARLMSQQPQGSPQQVCNICMSTTHYAENCVGFQENVGVNMVGYNNNRENWQPRRNEGGWQGKSNTYQGNSYGQSTSQQRPDFQAYKPPHTRQQENGDTPATKDMVEKMMDRVMGRLEAIEKKHDGAISELSKQMSQLARDVFELKDSQGKLPSQTITNPKSNVSAIAIKSADQHKKDKEVKGSESIPPKTGTRNDLQIITSNPTLSNAMQVTKPTNKYMTDKEIWDIFSKVEVGVGRGVLGVKLRR